MEHLILENGRISHDSVRQGCYFYCVTNKYEILELGVVNGFW